LRLRGRQRSEGERTKKGGVKVCEQGKGLKDFIAKKGRSKLSAGRKTKVRGFSNGRNGTKTNRDLSNTAGGPGSEAR